MNVFYLFKAFIWNETAVMRKYSCSEDQLSIPGRAKKTVAIETSDLDVTPSLYRLNTAWKSR